MGSSFLVFKEKILVRLVDERQDETVRCQMEVPLKNIAEIV